MNASFQSFETCLNYSIREAAAARSAHRAYERIGISQDNEEAIEDYRSAAYAEMKAGDTADECWSTFQMMR